MREGALSRINPLILNSRHSFSYSTSNILKSNKMASEWIGRRLTGEGVLSGVNALHDTFSLFLVQCIIILTICRLLGLLAARTNQPKVIFEIIGMILINHNLYLGKSRVESCHLMTTKHFRRRNSLRAVCNWKK